jgi:hypothetical protein
VLYIYFLIFLRTRPINLFVVYSFGLFLLATRVGFWVNLIRIDSGAISRKVNDTNKPDGKEEENR